SVGPEGDAFGNRLEGAQAAPDGHRQEERQVDDRADLPENGVGRRDRLRAQPAQDQEVDDEDRVQDLVPVGTVADGLDRRMVEPRQEEQDDDGAAHGHHAPELGVQDFHEDGDQDQDAGHGQAPDAREPALGEQQHGGQQGAGGHDPGEVAGGGAQHGVERREIPDRGDVRRGLQRIGREEVVVFQEVAAHFGAEEDDRGEHDQEAGHADHVVHRVVGMERDAVHGAAVFVLRALLDLDAVGVVGTHFVQGDDVRHDQADQHQGDGDHVEGEEAVQRGIGHDVVATDPQGQLGTDEGDGREQVDDHLGAPVGHLAPGQQVAEEGLAHQAQEDADAEDPDQFARL